MGQGSGWPGAGRVRVLTARIPPAGTPGRWSRAGSGREDGLGRMGPAHGRAISARPRLIPPIRAAAGLSWPPVSGGPGSKRLEGARRDGVLRPPRGGGGGGGGVCVGPPFIPLRRRRVQMSSRLHALPLLPMVMICRSVRVRLLPTASGAKAYPLAAGAAASGPPSRWRFGCCQRQPRRAGVLRGGCGGMSRKRLRGRAWRWLGRDKGAYENMGGRILAKYRLGRRSRAVRPVGGGR